jgi:hypothetical protein
MIFWRHLFIPDLPISMDGKYLIYFSRAILQKLKTGGMNSQKKEPDALGPTLWMMKGRIKGKGEKENLRCILKYKKAFVRLYAYLIIYYLFNTQQHEYSGLY